MDRAVYRALWLLVLTTLVGCVSPVGGRKTFCVTCPPGHALATANLLERGVIAVDAPLLAADTAIHAYPTGPHECYYRLLTPCECQYEAAAHANTAYLIDVERQLAIASIPPRPQSRMARGLRVHQQVLALRAAQVRNEAAGQALEVFYQLAAAEATIEVIDRTRAHVRDLLNYVHELQVQGIPSTLTVSELRSRELEALSRRAELEWTIAQLNGRLCLLVGWDLNSEARIWPQTDLVVVHEPIDVGAAVETGLRSRAELMTLRLLSSTLDEATLPLVRGALQTQDATLGNVTSGSERLSQLLRPARGEDELRARRAQLDALLVEKQRELAVAIHAAVGAVEMKRDQAFLTKQRLELARQRLRDLQQLRAAGQATPLEIFSQEGLILQIEAELVQSAAAWRLAEVELRELLGVLAWECSCGHCRCDSGDFEGAVVGQPLPIPAELEESLPAADEESHDADSLEAEPPAPPLAAPMSVHERGANNLVDFFSRKLSSRDENRPR